MNEILKVFGRPSGRPWEFYNPRVSLFELVSDIPSGGFQEASEKGFWILGCFDFFRKVRPSDTNLILARQTLYIQDAMRRGNAASLVSDGAAEGA